VCKTDFTRNLVTNRQSEKFKKKLQEKSKNNRYTFFEVFPSAVPKAVLGLEPVLPLGDLNRSTAFVVQLLQHLLAVVPLISVTVIAAKPATKSRAIDSCCSSIQVSFSFNTGLKITGPPPPP
jgi:hypothetical protein